MFEKLRTIPGMTDKLLNFEKKRETGVITLEDVKKWVEDDGRLPKIGSKDPIEKRYANWIQTQQKKPEMWEELRTIPGMTDKLLELEEKREGQRGKRGIPVTTLEDVKKWVENNGRLPKERSEDPIEARYGSWIHYRQRKQEMWEELRTIPGMTDKLLELEEKRETGVITLEDVKKWVEDNGRLPIYGSKDRIEERYAKWIQHQQEKPEMFEKLRTIPGMTDKLLNFEKKREGKPTLEDVKKWVEDNGRLPKTRVEGSNREAVYNGGSFRGSKTSRKCGKNYERSPA